jgi:hypothetical protein
MHKLCMLFFVASCSGGDKPTGQSTADAAIDAPLALALDCTSYCMAVQKSCTGANAQYADTAHCMATCASFSVGTSADTTGNTLGCRLHAAAAAAQKNAVVTNCPAAGPAGDSLTATTPGLCSGGDPCVTFCALEVQACGALKAPLSGDPTDDNGNPLFQYQNVADCMRFCPSFDKTHVYSITSMGDSLACRLLQATNAAVSLEDATMSCQATAANPHDACSGPATP